MLLQNIQSCYNYAPASPGLVTEKKIAFPPCRNFGSSKVTLSYVGMNLSLLNSFSLNGETVTEPKIEAVSLRSGK